jgi:hypothetical protein
MVTITEEEDCKLADKLLTTMINLAEFLDGHQNI